MPAELPDFGCDTHIEKLGERSWGVNLRRGRAFRANAQGNGTLGFAARSAAAVAAENCRIAMFALAAIASLGAGACAAGAGSSAAVKLRPAGGATRAMVAGAPSIGWRREVGPSLLEGPLVHGGVVLVATGAGKLLALSAETGVRHWSADLGGHPGHVGGIVGNRVIAATDGERGRVQAIDVRSGRRVWASAELAVHQAPAVRGDAVWVATRDGRVHELDGRTGATRWSVELPGRAAAPPVPFDDQVVVAARGDTIFHLSRAGVITARTALAAPVSAPLLLWRDVLLVPLHSGALLAYDPIARVVRWSAELGAPILARPVAGPDGAAYVLTDGADIWRITANPVSHGPVSPERSTHQSIVASTPERIARLGGAAVGSLATAGERLVVGRLDGSVIALRPNGEIVWEERLDDSIVAPSATAGGATFVPLQRGTLVRLESAAPR